MINVEAITEIAEQRRERNVAMRTRYMGELIAAESLGVDISAITTSERFRTVLPHEVARGARRLLTHEMLEGVSQEFRTDACKPITPLPAVRKRMGGFAG